ncbi:MAG: hypothetical protein JWO38_5701 [Gemmataceae bacterium]|nr:hypothetical protein [Gemmataceae bacterium]
MCQPLRSIEAGGGILTEVAGGVNRVFVPGWVEIRVEKD